MFLKNLKTISLLLAIVYLIESSNADDLFYVKDAQRSCNKFPVYKAKEQPSYMFRTLKGNWCDQYIPSGLIDCQTNECTEIRFDMPDWSKQEFAVPEELELHGNKFTWVPKTTHKIFCTQKRKSLKPKSVTGTTTSVPMTTTTTSTKAPATKSFKTHEQILDEKLGQLLIARNSHFNEGKDLTDDEINILDFLFNKYSPHQAVSLSGRKYKTDDSITDVQDTSTQSVLNKNKVIGSLFTKNSHKKEIKTCPKLEFYVHNDNDQVDMKLNFEIFFGVQCKDVPVYKSKENFFLYRNYYGYWCQDLLENFQITINCPSNCTQMRLGPIGIKTPIEAKEIEILQEQTQQVELVTQNFQYVCANFANCMTIGCLNGGTCHYSYRDNAPHYECICTPEFTDSLCSTINPCFSYKCQSGGSCLLNAKKQPFCECLGDFYGERCEFKNTTCKTNPCLNGGVCLKQLSQHEFLCKCSESYTGTFCQSLKEIKSSNLCANKKFGDFVSHPHSKNKFIICMNDMNNVQDCPKGLIFNPHVNRCDYNDNTPAQIHECNRNPCLNGGTCDMVETGYVCYCMPGFEGVNCEINHDDCADNTQCQPNGRCIDLIQGFVCICENNFYGIDCITNKMKIPCNGQRSNSYSYGKTQHLFPFDPSIIVECNEKGNLLLNKCPSSLYWNPFSSSCTYEPINYKIPIECLEKQCKNDATCFLDENNEPICLCKKGFEGDSCERNVDDCASNPCLNNGVCVDGVDGYICKCENKFLDQDCCCLGDHNPCETVMNDFNSKKDKTVRHAHPFSKEKFLVCNLEGWAQVLSCPDGLIWNEEEEACAHQDVDLNRLFVNLCTAISPAKNFTYPYSFLKFIDCEDVDNLIIRECPKNSPYFCENLKVCVNNMNRDCQQA